MAINPNLVSIIPASELPTGTPTSAGQFFFYEGNEMKKSPMSEIYELVSGSQSIGTITPSSTIPAEGNIWGFAAPGTYPNAGNLTVSPNTLSILTRVGTTWSKVEIEIHNNDELILKGGLVPVSFKGFPIESEYTYTNNAISATGGNFSAVITDRKTSIGIFDYAQWYVIGKTSDSVIILSVGPGDVGNYTLINNSKTLSSLTQTGMVVNGTFSPTDKCKIDLSDDTIDIYRSVDNGVNWELWGTVNKGFFPDYQEEILGVISLAGTVNVHSVVPKSADGISINFNDVKRIQTINDTNNFVIEDENEPSGVKLLSFLDFKNNINVPIQNPIPSGFTKIIASGTSITYGVGATDGNAGTSKWVSVAQTTLTNVLGRNINIVNGGISGQTTTGMKNNLQTLIDNNLDASIVVFECAINDCKTTSSGITLAESKSNLQTIIDTIKSNNMIPIMVTCAPINISVSSVASDFSIQKRSDLVYMSLKLAKDNNVRVVDLSNLSALNYNLMGDGLHPNDTGHRWWADLVVSKILE